MTYISSLNPWCSKKPPLFRGHSSHLEVQAAGVVVDLVDDVWHLDVGGVVAAPPHGALHADTHGHCWLGCPCPCQALPGDCCRRSSHCGSSQRHWRPPHTPRYCPPKKCVSNIRFFVGVSATTIQTMPMIWTQHLDHSDNQLYFVLELSSVVMSLIIINQ